MKLWTVSNLFPRLDRPQSGLYNHQLFRELDSETSGELRNICLVPEWRVWRWPAIRGWDVPTAYRDVPTVYAPAFYVPIIGRSWSSRFCVAALTRLHKSLGVEKPDAVVASWLYPDGVAASQFADEMGVPAILMVLGSDIFHLKNQSRKEMILRACDTAKGIVCVSDHLKKALVNLGVDSKKVHVVENGVDGEIFTHRPKADALKQLKSSCPLSSVLCPLENDSCRIILFVGNLVHIKGPDVMIDAFADLVNRYRLKVNSEKVTGVCPPSSGVSGELSINNSITNNYQQDLVLLILGEGKERRRLKRQAERLGVRDQIHFLGSRTHDEVAQWMNVADCLCLPSRSEGMPNVLVEALTSGLPVVATDVGACRDMLEDEPSSRVVSKEDVSDMAQALGDMLDMDTDRRAMAVKYSGKYSWRRMAESILDILDLKTNDN